MINNKKLTKDGYIPVERSKEEQEKISQRVSQRRFIEDQVKHKTYPNFLMPVYPDDDDYMVNFKNTENEKLIRKTLLEGKNVSNLRTFLPGMNYLDEPADDINNTDSQNNNLQMILPEKPKMTSLQNPKRLDLIRRYQNYTGLTFDEEEYNKWKEWNILYPESANSVWKEQAFLGNIEPFLQKIEATDYVEDKKRKSEYNIRLFKREIEKMNFFQKMKEFDDSFGLKTVQTNALYKIDENDSENEKLFKNKLNQETLESWNYNQPIVGGEMSIGSINNFDLFPQNTINLEDNDIDYIKELGLRIGTLNKDELGYLQNFLSQPIPHFKTEEEKQQYMSDLLNASFIFTKNEEGSIPHIYWDINKDSGQQKLTLGTGININSVEQFKNLPFEVTLTYTDEKGNEVTKTLTTSEEKERYFPYLIKEAEKYKNDFFEKSASAQKKDMSKILKFELSDADDYSKQFIKNDINKFVADLKSDGMDFFSLPRSQQIALLDMRYNLGPSFNIDKNNKNPGRKDFPKLGRALSEKNYLVAGNESNRIGLPRAYQNESELAAKRKENELNRNDRVKLLFQLPDYFYRDYFF